MLRRKIFYVVFSFLMCSMTLNITGCTQARHVNTLEDYRMIKKGFESTEENREDDNNENNPTQNPEDNPEDNSEDNTNDNKVEEDESTQEEEKKEKETETVNFYDLEIDQELSYGYYYDQISDDLKKIYNIIINRIDIVSKEGIEITNIDLDIEQFETVLEAINLDEFYYQINSYGYSVEENNVFIRISLQTNVTSSQKEAAEKKAYNIVKRINSNSEIELVQKIYDWCTKNIVYDKSLKKKHNRDLYGALIKKESVCVGYARAFSYMCKLAGIECINVQNTEHMYNYVQIDSKWYGVDTTGGKPGSHIFLLEGKEFMDIKEHIPFEDFSLPELADKSIFSKE